MNKAINRNITTSDDFINMPSSSQCLYFHLCMNEVDGCTDFLTTSTCIVSAKAQVKDLDILESKCFIVPRPDKSLLIITSSKLQSFLKKEKNLNG